MGNLNGIDAIVRVTVNQAVVIDDITRVDDIAKRRGVSAADVLDDLAMYGLSASGVTQLRQ
ncbi:hypothetical protein [Mycobacterium lacus]|uniref:Uncharacterized protein n=1 Tax=Mycobacterium lacus TaxID=169765 RepID=A0A1X1XKA1_9MYCO|nr:hypothetical protein [Mycobacterium lacus]MCV7123225.1 hypothetical protein [Mycobacterium lacus]ORV99158.1 hypothetical protein AWC15_10880 [Mycobacterium lacus]BBX99001.1 hypothetical protein MLAC_42950 [Mycobacterium lacus]